jgi:hypothetical protein
MHENKIYFFIFFNYYFIFFVLMKTRYLIPDLYLYSIKIQTNIDQNAVKYLWKITDLKKKIRRNFGPYGWAGLSQPNLVTGQSQ